MLGLKRHCREQGKDGQPCRATPQRHVDLCFWHDPEHEKEAADARRLGGIRRRREGVLRGTYDFDGLASVTDIRRILEVAAMDTLALDNSVARARALTAIAQVAARLLEVGDLEARLEAIEEVLGQRIAASGGRRR